MPKLKSLNNNVLKELLRSYDLNPQGTKAEMVTRLVEHLQADEIEQEVLDRVVPSTAHFQGQIDELKYLIGQLAGMIASSNQQTIITQQQTNAQPATTTRESESTLSGNDDIPPINQCTSFQNEDNAVDNRTWSSHSVKEIAATIPEFDPTNDSSVTVEQFIERIDASNEAYKWNQKSLLLAVYSKLKGAAKLWFDASEHFSSTWSDLQKALMNEFHKELDEAEVHRKMASAGRTSDARIEEYCFRIAAMGRRFKLSEQSIIRYTRDGLNYRELQSATSVMRFNSLKDMRETFLQFISNQQPQYQQKTNRQDRTETEMRKNIQVENVKPRNINEIKCYNCYELGDMSNNCPKPQRRRRCINCQKVHSIGEPENCEKNIFTSRRILSSDGMFIKTIFIDDLTLSAFVDTGSQCNMIRRSATKKLPNLKEPCLLTIKGVGGGVQHVNERIIATIVIDNIDLQVLLYIVEDDILDTDVLLGQDIFTNHGHVKTVIADGKLTFQVARTEISNPIAETVQIGEISNSEQLKEMLHDHSDCFSFGLNDIGQTDLVKLKIEMNTEKSIAQYPYRVPLTEKNNRWDEHLHEIQWTLNSTINATTKRSPHNLLFGYQTRDILGNKLVLALHDATTPIISETDRSQVLFQQRKIAKQNIAENRAKAKQRYDCQHAKPTQYENGNLVLVKNEAPSMQTSRKLEPKFKGPFLITAVLGNDRYVVEDLPGSQRKTRHYSSVHASDSMKLWCCLPPDDLLPDDNDSDEDIEE